MRIRNLFSTVAPALTLFLLSPIIAELLFGSTPVSRSNELIFESLYYGSGAVLIREVVRRYNLVWLSIIVLGIAFGIIVECVTLQSVFNPNFLGNNLAYGRMLGVNWVWGLCIIGYHAIWSISVPVLFAELLFPGKKTQPWLSKVGIWIMSVIYILSAFAFYTIFHKISGFQASLVYILTAIILATLLIVLSFRIPVSPTFKNNLRKFPPFMSGVIAFTASALWFGLLILVFKPNPIPPLLAELAGLVIILIVLFILLSWSKQNWNDNDHFFLASGCLYASMFFGLNTLSQSGKKLDFIFQICFIIITTILLVLLKKRLVIVKE
jgi:hypothetical protein